MIKITMLISVTILFLFLHQDAQASCLGLKPPAPVTTNICETLVEKLIVPNTEIFCDIPTWARVTLPHCNLPGACLTSPSCKSFQVTKEIASTIYNAGDLYCDMREISASKMIKNIGRKAYKDLTILTTGGTTSILYQTASAHIDIMSCSGISLNEKLKQAIKCVVSNSSESQNSYFSSIDIDYINIISNETATAKLYLRDGFAAITLNDLVIINEIDFQVLKNWNKKIGEPLNPNERSAIELIIHELVHVRQYRNMGKEVFINSYLTEAIQNGYANISTEKEAKQFETKMQCYTSRLSCIKESLQSFSIGHNAQKKSLSPTGVGASACKAYDEGVLVTGQLIRSTDGITNMGTKNISIYCPVDTDTTSDTLNVAISFTTKDVRTVCTNVIVPENLECWLAYKYGPSRRYIKFFQKGNGADFKTYVNVKTNWFESLPVTIKCNLRPNEHIIDIKSN